MINVYCMYGLGGRFWSAGMEDVLAYSIRMLPNINCPPTRSWSAWECIVDEIKKLPEKDKVVLIGHSLGAAKATHITDHVDVDLLVLYDLAGQPPSRIGKRTGRCIDIYDTVFDLVPEWRVQAVEGYEDRIERWTSRFGHTGQDDSVEIASKVVQEIKKLAELNIKE